MGRNCVLFSYQVISLLSLALLGSGCLRMQMIGPAANGGSDSASSSTLSANFGPASVSGAEQTLSVSASGGVAPYSYSVVSGDGSVSAGVLHTGWSASNVIKITDSKGVSTQVSVSKPSSGVVWGGNGVDSVTGIEIAQDNSIIVYGQTWSTSLPDGLTYQGAGGGFGDVFMVKYDSAGKKVFSKSFGTANGDSIQNHGVSTDALGNIYFTGHTLGSLPGFVNPGGGWTGWDAFIGKLDSAGNLQWLKEYPNTADEVSYGLVVDPATGVSTMAGWSQTTFPGSPTAHQGGGNDCFVAQADASGNLNGNAYDFGTAGSEICRNIARDRSGNIIVAGYSSGAIPGHTNGTGSYCGIFAKFTSSLALVWLNQIPCNAPNFPLGLDVDSNGDIFFSGYTNGNQFGTLAGVNDLIYGKLDGNTGNLLWGKQDGVAAGDANAGVPTIRALSDGTIALSANLGGAAWAGYTLSGTKDAYLMRVNSTGNLLWRKQVSSAAAEDLLLTVDSHDNIFTAVNSTATLPLLGVTPASAGTGDAFLFKFDINGSQQ